MFRKTHKPEKVRKNKDISTFPGECLIIGGGWWEKDKKIGTKGPIWRTDSDFFTIDMDKKREPDLLANILTLSTNPADYKKKFKFIFFENFCLDGTKNLNNIEGDLVSAEEEWVKMLKFARALLADDGLLVYSGGYNTKSFRPKSFLDLFKETGFESVAETLLDSMRARRTTMVCASIAASVELDLKEPRNFKHLPMAAQNCIVGYIAPQLLSSTPDEAKPLALTPPQNSNQKLEKAAKTMQSFFRKKIATNSYLQKIKAKTHTFTDEGKFEEVQSLAKLATQIQERTTTAKPKKV